MQLPEGLVTVFSCEIGKRDGVAVVRLPERELRLGALSVGDTYQVAILERPETDGGPGEGERASVGQRTSAGSEPPVEEGEQYEVEIEEVGDRGDGIAKVGSGYIVFVPGAGIGDRVTVEITGTRENFGFAEVVEAEPIADR